MSPRAALLSIALLFFIVGAVLGLTPRTSSDGFSDEGVDCGSVFKPVSRAGQIEDDITGSDVGGSCSDKRAAMKPWTLGAFGLAGVSLIVSFVAANNTGVVAPKE